MSPAALLTTALYVAAHTASKATGYAFAVKWPSGNWSVETRKPSARMPGMAVVECSDGRELIA